jgi:hypothetical protein
LTAWHVCRIRLSRSPRRGATRIGTIRTQLINTPGWIARSAGRLILHLPQRWPWEAGLDQLFRRGRRAVDPVVLRGGTHAVTEAPREMGDWLARPEQ